MNLYQVQNFLDSDKRPKDFAQGKKRILELLAEISQIYKDSINKRIEGLCDICGKGDTSDIFRLKDLIPGYKRRPEKSPRLCYNHFCGWNLSLTLHQSNTIWRRCEEAGDDTYKIVRINTKPEMETKYGLTDEEIDLHFAKYLSNKLLQEAKLYKLKEKK